MNKSCLFSLPLLLPLLLGGCQKKTDATTTTTTTTSSSATPAALSSSPASPTASAAPSAAASATPNPNGCIVLDPKDSMIDGPPVTLEGTVIIDTTFEHPTKGAVRPYILKLAAAKCVLNGGDELKSVTEIHIAPEGGIEVKPFVGKKVRLVDGKPFHSHTAWHARDIVVMTKKLVAL